jgi:hypothetical protein
VGVKSAVAVACIIAAVSAFASAIFFVSMSNAAMPLGVWLGTLAARSNVLFVAPLAYVAVAVVLETLLRAGGRSGVEREPGSVTWSNWLSRTLLAMGVVLCAISVLEIFANWNGLEFALVQAHAMLDQTVPVFAWGAGVEYLDHVANRAGAPATTGSPPFAQAAKAMLIAAIVVYVLTAPLFVLGALQAHAAPGAPDYALNFLATWLFAPTILLGWAGIIAQLRRILSALFQSRAASA